MLNFKKTLSLSFTTSLLGQRPFLTSPTLSRPQYFLNRAFASNFYHDHSTSQIRTAFHYSNSFHFSSVHNPFDEMSHREIHRQDTHVDYVLCLLKTSLKRESLIVVHCLAVKIGILSHLPISTLFLTHYSSAGDLVSSLKLFDEACGKDVILWNAIITVLIQNSCFGLVVDFFVGMLDEDGKFDSTTLLLVVSAFAHLKWLRQGRMAHCLGIQAGMLPDSSLCNALVNMYAKCGDLNASERMFTGTEHKNLVSWNTVISGCISSNLPEKALWYFKKMTEKAIEIDSVSLSCSISASACLDELGLGEGIHGLVIKLGCNSSFHVSVANSLISLYSQCSDINGAEAVFEGMVHKDIVSWNAMIDGFASNGFTFEAFDHFKKMHQIAFIQPDKATILTIIPLCAELMLLKEGRTVHGYTVRRELNSDVSVTNSLIDMYSKCKKVPKAELLFHTLVEKDLVSWNTIISAYSKTGLSQEAQKLFMKLLSWCKEFTLSTLLAILPSCDSCELLPFGESVHCWQLKIGFTSNILASNSLLNMYFKCKDLTTALDIFKLMGKELNFFPDVSTLTSVITACGNLELNLAGKSLHGLALKTLMASDISVQNTLITMYGRCWDTESALSVFRSSSNRNLCSWNCMISAFSQNKAGRKVFELFRILEFEPNEITIVGLLSACTRLGVLSHGEQIHSYVFRHCLTDNAFICAALVDMYSNCGKLETALKIFRTSPEQSIACWNSMISAYGFHGNGRKAIEVFDRMCVSGIKPTKSTFTSLLSACSHSGLVKEGIWYHNHMLDRYGVEPVTEHRVYIVDMLGRSGRLKEAYEFIMQMQTKPEVGVWGAMLSACKCHGDAKMGKEVAELLFEMEPENAGYYICLSNMYVSAGRWKDAVEIRNIVENKRLRKAASYSLIDVGFG